MPQLLDSLLNVIVDDLLVKVMFVRFLQQLAFVQQPRQTAVLFSKHIKQLNLTNCESVRINKLPFTALMLWACELLHLSNPQ